MLVSNLTGTIDSGSRLMHELISSCYQAYESFRSAAATSEDDILKRLLEIYAQQRSRFAEELREHLLSHGDNAPANDRCEWNPSLSLGEDSLRDCLESDSRTLQLYRQALCRRDLPTRTHFLISSQLALLERAHERVSTLANRTEMTRPTRAPSVIQA